MKETKQDKITSWYQALYKFVIYLNYILINRHGNLPKKRIS